VSDAMVCSKLYHESSFRAEAPQGEVITGTTQVIPGDYWQFCLILSGF
jgi:hypothetical protein